MVNDKSNMQMFRPTKKLDSDIGNHWVVRRRNEFFDGWADSLLFADTKKNNNVKQKHDLNITTRPF